MSTPPLADDFGTWLRRLRRQRDRTQEALADEVGCAVYTLRAIEAGRRRPSREMAERLAAVLGLPAEQWPRFVQLARSGQAPKDEVPAAGSPAPGTPTASLPELLSTNRAPAHGTARAATAAQLQVVARPPCPCQRYPLPRHLAALDPKYPLRLLAGPAPATGSSTVRKGDGNADFDAITLGIVPLVWAKVRHLGHKLGVPGDESRTVSRDPEPVDALDVASHRRS